MRRRAVSMFLLGLGSNIFYLYCVQPLYFFSQGLANYLTVDSVSKLKRKQFSETNTAVSGSGASANSDGSNTQQQ